MMNLASLGRQSEGSKDSAALDASTGEHSADHDAGESHESRQQQSFRLLRVALGVIRLGPVLILGVLILTMTLLSPVFMTTGNAGNVLSQTAR